MSGELIRATVIACCNGVVSFVRREINYSPPARSRISGRSSETPVIYFSRADRGFYAFVMLLRAAATLLNKAAGTPGFGLHGTTVQRAERVQEKEEQFHGLLAARG